MQHPCRPLAAYPVPVRRTAAAWIGLALIAVSGSFAITPSAMAASGAQSCPSGQIAATRIDYEGKYNLDPTVDMWNLRALTPNVGYTRRTVLVAEGYYKEASEGTIVVMKDKPPGKSVPIPSPDNRKLYARELPSRFVIIETAKQKLVYDERGDPENLGTRAIKSRQFSAAEERAIVGGLQTAFAGSAAEENTKVLGKATYAGIPCDVRQALVPGNSWCIGRVRGQYVNLAEDMQFPNRPERSWMHAKTKADVCVSAREFEPPAHVRFKSGEPRGELTEEEEREADAFFEAARKAREEE
jgi:hypothetical protein